MLRCALMRFDLGGCLVLRTCEIVRYCLDLSGHLRLLLLHQHHVR